MLVNEDDRNSLAPDEVPSVADFDCFVDGAGSSAVFDGLSMSSLNDSLRPRGIVGLFTAAAVSLTVTFGIQFACMITMVTGTQLREVNNGCSMFLCYRGSSQDMQQLG